MRQYLLYFTDYFEIFNNASIHLKRDRCSELIHYFDYIMKLKVVMQI